MTAATKHQLGTKKLYLVIHNWHRDSNADMSHIEEMSGGVFDESPEESQSRIGSKLYNKISNLLTNQLHNLDLSITKYDLTEHDLNEEFIETAALLLDSKKAVAFSPLVTDFVSVRFVGNIDFLLLPSSENDVSGAYEISDEQTAYVLPASEVTGIVGLSESLDIFEDKDSLDEGSQLMTLLAQALNTLKSQFEQHFNYFRIFMLDHEWENRQSFEGEYLPDSISFEKKNGQLHVKTPGFMSYHTSMYDEGMILGYYGIRASVAKWFDVQVSDIYINVAFDYELLGFKVADNVWIESVFDPSRVGERLGENRYWWDTQKIEKLVSKTHDASTVAQWLKSEGATNVTYFTFLEHDAGKQVAYAVSVFKARKRIVQFTVSAFDWKAGVNFMSELEAALDLPFVCSEVKEGNWGIIELNPEGFPGYIMPQAPLLAKEHHSIIGLHGAFD